jgi:hypothetical protein
MKGEIKLYKHVKDQIGVILSKCSPTISNILLGTKDKDPVELMKE